MRSLFKHSSISSRKRIMMSSIVISIRYWMFLGALLFFFAPIVRSGEAESRRAADELLRMAPADAAIVATVENLRDRAPLVLESPIVKRLWELPAVRMWWESEGSAKILSARDQIERSLGYPWRTLRDEVLGDAVVAAFAFDPGAPNDTPRGLIMLRARDPKILESAVKNANDARRRDKSLVSIELRHVGSIEYHRRTFVNGTRPDDFLAILPGGTLIWSNNEAWLKRAIDRDHGDLPKGLGENPLFQAVRGDLPGDSLIQIFVDPRFLEKLLKAQHKIDRDGEKGIRFLLALLEPIRYAAAAIAWRDGPVLDARQIVDRAKPSKAADPATDAEIRLDDLAKRIPGEPLLVAAGRIDWVATGTAVLDLLDDDEREAIDLTHTFVKGMLLGNDLKTSILPAIQSGIFVVANEYQGSTRRDFERPSKHADAAADKNSSRSSQTAARQTRDDRTASASGSDFPFQLLGILQTTGDEDAPRGAIAAIENLLESTLAFLALTTDPSSKLAERSIGSAKVHRIEGAQGNASPAFARDRTVFVVGSTADIVERACAFENNHNNISRFEQFRRSRPKTVNQMIFIDMRSLRDWIARRAEAAEAVAIDATAASGKNGPKPQENRIAETAGKSRRLQDHDETRLGANTKGEGGIAISKERGVGSPQKSPPRNDLEHVGRLLDLFDYAFITNETSRDRSIARQTAGIIAAGAKKAP